MQAWRCVGVGVEVWKCGGVCRCRHGGVEVWRCV